MLRTGSKVVCAQCRKPTAPDPKNTEALFFLWSAVYPGYHCATQAGRPKRQSAACEETVNRTVGERTGVGKKIAARFLRRQPKH